MAGGLAHRLARVAVGEPLERGARLVGAQVTEAYRGLSANFGVGVGKPTRQGPHGRCIRETTQHRGRRPAHLGVWIAEHGDDGLGRTRPSEHAD